MLSDDAKLAIAGREIGFDGDLQEVNSTDLIRYGNAIESAIVPPGHVVVPENPPDWLLFHLMDAVWYSVEGDIEITKTEARSIYRKFIATSQEKT